MVRGDVCDANGNQTIAGIRPFHDSTQQCPQVIVNERAVRAIDIINTGSLAYDFEWDIGTNPRISVRA